MDHTEAMMDQDYALIRRACLAQAERYAGTAYAKTLRQVALDCDYAAEGCKASAQSVAETLAEDHELYMRVSALPVEAEARACVRSTIGMAA